MLPASITRVRSVRYLLEFLWRAVAGVCQSRATPGCLFADVRREAKLVFWTRTVGRDELAVRAFMTNGAHRVVMPNILDWCDEASLAHWPQDGDTPPDWPAAEMKARSEGRTSRVRNPSAAQAPGETVPAV
jgi:hypothetical protein